MGFKRKTPKQKMNALMAAARKLVTPEDILKCYINNHDNPDVPWDIRIKMKESLMDRGYGKAVASLEIANVTEPDDDFDQGTGGAALAALALKVMRNEELTEDEQRVLAEMQGRSLPPKQTVENADGTPVETK